MVWSAPMTATAGAFTAAQWNTYVRDNLNATEAAVASGMGSYWFASTGANALALREVKSDYVDDDVTTTSTSYGNLTGSAGPAVTLTTGTKVIVQLMARLGNDTVNSATQATFNITGATTRSGDETVGIISDGLENSTSGDNLRTVSAASLVSVTAGTNTFTMKYKCSSGTGRFSCRRIVVWSL